MSRNNGSIIGPFDSGKSIFDFLDNQTLNKIAKAVNQYSNLSVRPPLQLQTGAHGTVLSLAQDIQNFFFVQLTEDLAAEGSAEAFILKRDSDDVVNYDEATDQQLTVTVHDFSKTKSYTDDIGFALKNPYGKTGALEFVKIQGRALWIEGKINNAAGLLEGNDNIDVDNVIYHLGPVPATAVTNVSTPLEFAADDNADFIALLNSSGGYSMINVNCEDQT